MDEYKIKSIEEGLTKIEFPEFDKISSDAPVFYNPNMELNRDLSILAIQVFQKQEQREINICDLFGGSGIRGVRYKNEIDGVRNVCINDISEIANHYERHNIELNNLDDIEVFQHDASMFLRMKRGEFDVIDIDPFGTPSPFLDSAGYCSRRNSLLCVTATDTSALCGTYKEPCIRKYNAKPYKSEYCHETGIRILSGFVALTLSKYAKCIEVKMSHSTEHYMRLYLYVKKGSKRTDESLKNIGYISHCKNCLHRQTSMGLAGPIEYVCPVCGEKLIHAGPLWLGDIQNEEFIQKMIDETENKKINREKQALKLLNSCLKEAKAPATFYDVHKICKSLKASAPKLDLIFEELRKEGFIAIKTHYNPLGIKTDATIKDIENIILKLCETENI
ncbi:tRNA (guanine(10)-N(2))-dimethyltransferase [Methanobrevibacter sp.]|uniref:tRNA (guanine(10)-N(2))-dimethyltransferase n=1 Tax=Methanobrevibacter sp. TaxID=66852 RepID=UPI0025EE07BE|nr:tRNA (guanine(10)-N(2))-dimethyltransferase [Methanobrevibacter sp.]MBQ2831003.1 tRNA (guanine(26)-N(2))-dimethyltransferase [Methanobrevibacter sp.]